MNQIAFKNTFMVGIRIGVIILVILFMLFPNEDTIFTYLQYVMIAYGIYNLYMLIMQILQPKVLITHDESYITIWGIRKNLKVGLDDINFIEARQSRTRGVSHKYGSLLIKLLNGRIIKIYNVDNVIETKSSLDKLINLY